jgi:hypothetical protein
MKPSLESWHWKANPLTRDSRAYVPLDSKFFSLSFRSILGLQKAKGRPKLLILKTAQAKEIGGAAGNEKTISFILTPSRPNHAVSIGNHRHLTEGSWNPHRGFPDFGSEGCRFKSCWMHYMRERWKQKQGDKI